MATNTSASSEFNPDLQPTQDPNYLYRLSRPIGDLKNYGATAAAISGVGDVTGDIVKVAHEVTQENIEDKIHTGVDQIRDPYSQQLGDTLATLQNGGQKVKVTSGSSVSDASLLSTPTAGAMPPDAVKNIDNQAQAIVGAKADGKISQTDYKMRLDTLTKDLRSQYPGFRDYISQKVAAVSNEGVADDLIKSRIADINSFIDTKKSEKDKVGDLLLAPEYRNEPGIPEMYMLHKQGAVSDYDALKFVNKLGATNATLKRAKDDLELGDVGIKQRAQPALQIAAQDANQGITNIMSSVLAASGMDKNPEKAQESLAKATPEQIHQFQANLETKLQAFYLQQRDKWGMPYKSDPNRSLAIDMGLDKVMPTLENAAAPYKAWSEKLGGKDFTYAGIIAKQTQDMHDIAENNMTKDPDMGPFLTTGKTLEKNFGSGAIPALIDTALLEDMPGKYRAYVRRQLQRNAANEPQPDTGTVHTLQDNILESQKNVLNDTKIPKDLKNANIAKLADTFIRQIEKIPDASTPDEVKRRFVEQTFSPEGRGLIARMELDGVGPNGKVGAYSVFKRLQSEDMTDAVKKLGGQHWEMYKDWSKSTLQNELLAPEIRRLNNLQSEPNMKITWDDRNFHFNVKFGKNINAGEQPDSPFLTRTTGPAVSDFTTNSTQQFFTRLNGALDKYSYVENKDAGDVSARVIKMLVELGFDPTIGKPDGINKQMIDAMVSTSKAKRDLQDQLEKKYKK